MAYLLHRAARRNQSHKASEPTPMKPCPTIIASILLFPLLPLVENAAAQTAPQCSLEDISAALNALPCETQGAFVSIESLIQGVTEICEPTPTEESCLKCFRRSRDKINQSIKTLIKLALLPPSTLSDFRYALREAEASVCMGEQQGEEGSPAPVVDDHSQNQGGGERPQRRQRPRSRDSTSPDSGLPQIRPAGRP